MSPISRGMLSGMAEQASLCLVTLRTGGHLTVRKGGHLTVRTGDTCDSEDRGHVTEDTGHM